MPGNLNKRMRYTRQSIINNTFFQMPRFLFMAEFTEMSNNARVLYTLMLDRHRISIKNNWFDENGEAFIYFKREAMQNDLKLSDKTVVKVLNELKELVLVDEKQQGLNKPNRIYLLAPVFDNSVSPPPDDDSDYDSDFNADSVSEPVNTTAPDTETFRTRTRNNSVCGHGEITGQGTEILRPNNNKLINNKKKNINMSDTELSKTTATDSADEIETASPLAAEAAAESPSRASPSIPFSKILELYNQLCETHGLRSIRSIEGKRKTQTAARFKEYGLSGFIDLFNNVSTSVFLCGGGERGWKADFDWLIAPTNMQKVLEGKYNDNQNNVPLQQPIYDTHQTSGFTTPQKNTNERHDPFLERAMMAYETAARTAQ